MTQGPLRLAVGLILLFVGLIVLTRRGGSQQAVYGRRIGGMMLTGGGFALTLFWLVLHFERVN